MVGIYLGGYNHIRIFDSKGIFRGILVRFGGSFITFQQCMYKSHVISHL